MPPAGALRARASTSLLPACPQGARHLANGHTGHSKRMVERVSSNRVRDRPCCSKCGGSLSYGRPALQKIDCELLLYYDLFDFIIGILPHAAPSSSSSSSTAPKELTMHESLQHEDLRLLRLWVNNKVSAVRGGLSLTLPVLGLGSNVLRERFGFLPRSFHGIFVEGWGKKPTMATTQNKSRWVPWGRTSQHISRIARASSRSSRRRKKQTCAHRAAASKACCAFHCR